MNQAMPQAFHIVICLLLDYDTLRLTTLHAQSVP